MQTNPPPTPSSQATLRADKYPLTPTKINSEDIPQVRSTYIDELIMIDG